ncbi:MAG: F0F1 ATP synthase subunit B [Clostridia bacterium]|nr:F0F1 ATP synthase subunit B [Clostridia bacterium]
MELQWFLEKFEDFVGVNLWTMLFAWLNLLILYLILKKIAFVPLKNMIDSRQKEVDDMYGDAEKSRADAEALKADYEERMGRAKEESEEIVKSAIRRAQLREEEILRDADKKAERVIERAEEQIELEKKRMVNEVKDEVSKMAIDIATAVIERDVSEDEHKELIDSFIDKMG